MFTVQLRNLFFKKNLQNLELLIEDQASTYAILRYAQDVPSSTFNKALDYLVENYDVLIDRRLIRLVSEYIKATGVGIVEFTDEYDYSIDITINQEEPFGECDVFYDFEEEF